MRPRTLLPYLLVTLFAGVGVVAQPNNPIVHLSITLPDGERKAVSAPESGLARITLKDGTEIEFRPTIQDSKPWTRVIVTIFKAATATHPTEQLGDVDVKTGGPAVSSKTTPAFRIAVTSVAEPAA